MSTFYFTSGSSVVSKIIGDKALYQSIAESKGYEVNISSSPDVDVLDNCGLIYFDGEYVREKPTKPSDDSYWCSLTTSWVEDLQVIKNSQKSKISEFRLIANESSFTFDGREIACNQLSRSDIDAINGLILLNGSFPAGFTNEWKAIDNTYVQIPDIATWTSFYGAMVSLGIDNFQKAQAKKAAIDAATTIAEVKAITWDDPPSP